MNERYQDIERDTGLRLDASNRESVPSLNELPGQTLERLSQLGRFDQHLVLRHLLPSDARVYFDAFLDAIGRGEDASSWGANGVLVPDVDLAGLATVRPHDLLELISQAGTDLPWIVVVPDLEAWRSGDATVGAPGLKLPPSVNYRWQPPRRTTRLMRPHRPVEATDDPHLATLRWIASRLARAAGDRPPEEVLREAVSDPSAEAISAARVLQREHDELGPQDGVVPGFRAPAEWYAG